MQCVMLVILTPCITTSISICAQNNLHDIERPQKSNPYNIQLLYDNDSRDESDGKLTMNGKYVGIFKKRRLTI
jgi:hypothetical protein